MRPLTLLVLLASAGCRDARTPDPADVGRDGLRPVEVGQDARLAADGGDADTPDAGRDATPERLDTRARDIRDGGPSDAPGDANLPPPDTSSDTGDSDAEAGTDARTADARRDGDTPRDAGDAATGSPGDVADGGPPDAPLLSFERHRELDELRCPPGDWPAPVLPPLARGVPEGAELGVKWIVGPGVSADLFAGGPPRLFNPHHALVVTPNGGVCTAGLFQTFVGLETPACFGRDGRIRWVSSGVFGPVTLDHMLTAPDGLLYWATEVGIMVTVPNGDQPWEERMLVQAEVIPHGNEHTVAELWVGPSGTLLAYLGFPMLLSRCGEAIWSIRQSMILTGSTSRASFHMPVRGDRSTHEVLATGEVAATYRTPGRTTTVHPVTDGLLMWREYVPDDGELASWVGFSAPGDAAPRSLTRIDWGPFLALPDETVVGWFGAPDHTLHVLRPGEEQRTLQFERGAAEPVLGAGPVLLRGEAETGFRDVRSAEDCSSRLAVYDLNGGLRSTIDLEGVCFPSPPLLAPDGTAYSVAVTWVEDAPALNPWDHLLPVLVAVQTDVPGPAPGISRWPLRDPYGMGSTVADRMAAPAP